MQSSNIIKISLLFFIVIAGGTAGYYFIEKDWSLFDSLYMTIISITTVGYGETKPLTQAGRVFTIFLIFFGLGTAAIIASNLAKTFIENNFLDIYGANKMKKQIKALKNHFIICGFGDIGSSICSVLNESEIPFVVIESDNELSNKSAQRGFLTINGEATLDTVLMQAGIENAQGTVICLGDDSTNIHVSLAAREINSDTFIIVRGYGSNIEKRMVRAGANSVINPLKLGGRQIAEQIINRYSKSNTIIETTAQRSELMGYSLKMYQHFKEDPVQLKNIKANLGVKKILKICKIDGTEIHDPSDDVLVANNEVLLVLVNEEKKEIIAKTSDFERVYIEWSNDLITGIPTIDEEHYRLFEFVNEFLSAVNKGKEKEIMVKTFDDLIEYTDSHFKSEEEMFINSGYPEKDAHIQEHEKLTKEVLNLNKTKNYIFSKNIADFLNSWLKEHILNSDMKFKEYLNNNDLI